MSHKQVSAVGRAILAVILVVVAAIAAVIAVRQHHSRPTAAPAPAAHAATVYVFPLGHLNHPASVTLDAGDNLFITDTGNQRVLKLPRGGATATEIPFTSLHYPGGIAVDNGENIYVTDTPDRLGMLDAATGAQTVLTTGWRPSGVAVDRYIANTDSRLVKVDYRTGAQTNFAFDGLHGGPVGVAVDKTGTLYVTGFIEHRALKIAPGTTTPAKLPFPGLEHPGGITVDAAGNVYLVDEFLRQFFKLAPGASSPVPLPLTGLDYFEAAAVDHAGNVYVANTFNDRVVKLAAPA